MPRPKSPQPTDAELVILQVLWSRGPGTVRDVHEALSASRDVGYTTTLKLLQIMHDKGLVRRDESQRTHRYTAALSEESTQGKIVRDVIDRVFGGSARALLQRALAAKPASRKELNQIRKLLDEFEGKEGSR